jgi:hypothetical protein
MVHSSIKTRTKEEQEQVHFAVEDTPNHLSIVCTQPKQSIVDITLIVPAQATTQLSILERGELIISSASRKVKAFVQEGDIAIIMSTDGSIDACAEQGAIEVTCQAFSSESALFLRAPQGGIVLSLPELVQATLDAKVDLGIVRSEIPITFEPFTTELTKQTWKHMQRRAKGSFGEGGSPIVLIAHTNIAIKRYEP